MRLPRGHHAAPVAPQCFSKVSFGTAVQLVRGASSGSVRFLFPNRAGQYPSWSGRRSISSAARSYQLFFTEAGARRIAYCPVVHQKAASCYAERCDTWSNPGSVYLHLGTQPSLYQSGLALLQLTAPNTLQRAGCRKAKQRSPFGREVLGNQPIRKRTPNEVPRPFIRIGCTSSQTTGEASEIARLLRNRIFLSLFPRIVTRRPACDRPRIVIHAHTTKPTTV